MAQVIPWSEFESEYAENFPTEMGAPADISYQTDLGLLNRARVHTEKTIDILYKQIKDKTNKKPRTYRNLAKKNYLAVAKQRVSSRHTKI